LKSIYIILPWLFIAASCQKPEDIPVNTVPFISVDSVNRSTVVQFKDSLWIWLKYEDGDGDLGEINPDINSLSVQDSRFSEPDYYFIPPQAPVDVKVKIRGRFVLKMRNLFLLGTGHEEKTGFSIRLRDRAGNWSNTVQTPQISIRR